MKRDKQMNECPKCGSNITITIHIYYNDGSTLHQCMKCREEWVTYEAV